MSERSKNRQSDHTYTLIKPTGNGAFGMVYKAKDNQNGRIVAVKKVFQDQRYKNRELSIIKELKHENCCYLYDYFYSTASDNPDEEYLNLIMEYMPETLSKEVRNYSKQKKNMPLLLIKLYSYQIIRGLAYLHALGICHRDMKPQNILTDPETHKLKICDFDSSLEQIVEIIKVLGTPNKSQIQSMNPEYKEYKFPIIKPESWEKVFKGKNMPKEFFDLIDKMLIFSPEKRTKPIFLLGHPFFDELRDKNTKLENGKNLPDLFNFNKTEMKIAPKFIKEKLIPDWYQNNNANKEISIEDYDNQSNTSN